MNVVTVHMDLNFPCRNISNGLLQPTYPNMLPYDVPRRYSKGHRRYPINHIITVSPKGVSSPPLPLLTHSTG